MQIFKQFKIARGLIFSLIIFIPVVISSCYTDYGLTTDNYDVVGSFYNPDYNFNNVTKYFLIDSVIHRDGGIVSRQYDDLILSTTESNLNALNWTRVFDSTGAGVISVATFVSTTSYVVDNSGGCWYDYWGYSWCYPYYGYSYEYSTGTVGVAMADVNSTSGNSLPMEWIGVANGVIGQGGSTNQRITSGINKAFDQSPYLK